MIITLAALMVLAAHNAPGWLAALESTTLNKGREAVADKGKELVVTGGSRMVRRIFQLDEKEQIRHLEQALKNAIERGLIRFDSLEERDQYRDTLQELMQTGLRSEELRKEALQLFTLSETPNLVGLNDKYNRIKNRTALAHNEPFVHIDTTPYLTSFFNALLAELYADPYFKQQLSETLQLRAVRNMQQSLLDVVALLRQIGETLENNYSAEKFAQDVEKYTAYMERTLRSLKLVGFVPKDKNKDPELEGIFVPLRISLQDQSASGSQQIDSLVSALEQFTSLVLLGGPGSGKSTAIRYLAWSHAVANQLPGQISHVSLLSGCPLPLRIELRRLSEERRQHNYSFLSFATEVLLEREGIDINQHMFKELLARRMMLLLFDGLDEVATPDERIRLVEEVEHFTQNYPGNRVLVTSRPIGYDIARFSNQLFSHAQIEPFNNAQIQQFLQNWYTYVLGLSPLPHVEQEEMKLLLKTLQDNSRLHKLAENPLLLTVITELHKYERLPDRRVLIYDRSADLLLEIWAKTKGTYARWKDMKMVKEDQYACVAHLGFVLHQRSQEEEQTNNEENTDNITNDVTTRVMLKEIERFLQNRKLISEVAQQRIEAKSFIELMKVEAGLIVERGTDTNGENLYCFVHRTFQEYFAAVDIYERFQQAVDLSIISDYLIDHLHDPHWHEVTLLLLGKMKPRPVTNLLRSIFSGKIMSNRSKATHILQQDLFFISDCLIEEIAVEKELVDMIVARLKSIVENSPFLKQRKDALDYLGNLLQTRQYASQGLSALSTFVTEDGLLSIPMRIEVANILYQRSPFGSETRQLATQMLTTLLQRSDLSADQALQTAESLYQSSSAGSETRLLATQMLTSLLQRSDFSADQARQTAESLLQRSYGKPEAKQLTTQMLTTLLQRSDLSADQACQTAVSLYRCNPAGSDARLLATTILFSLILSPNVSEDQREVYEILNEMIPYFDKIIV